MRMIWHLGQRVGPDPIGYAVYLYRHGEIDRYVGKGVRQRWKAHLKLDPNTDNWDWYEYRCKHLHEMSCFIIAEGTELKTATEQAEREIVEIDRRGLACDGTGTLLNARRGSVDKGRAPRGQRTSPVSLRWAACLALTGDGPMARRGRARWRGRRNP